MVSDLERSAAEGRAQDERKGTAVDEREVKLAAPSAFAMPDLSTAAEGLRVAARTERTTTTYHDTDGLRLARQREPPFPLRPGLDRETTRGTRSRVLRRPELTFEGAAGTTCGREPRPRDDPDGPAESVVRLRTVRTRSILEYERRRPSPGGRPRRGIDPRAGRPDRRAVPGTGGGAHPGRQTSPCPDRGGCCARRGRVSRSTSKYLRALGSRGIAAARPRPRSACRRRRRPPR